MILCCGEALIDMIPAPTHAGPDGFVPHSGGAVFNTAIALGRLGAKCGLLTALSQDLFGHQLRAELQASHVELSHLIQSPRPSTLAFVTLRDGQATYAFFDENSAERMLRPDDLPTLAPEVSALFFGGISLAREPSAEVYADLAACEHADKVVMLDPNIRQSFVEDEDRYRTRLAHLIGVSDIVKISDEDLNWLRPGQSSLNDKISWLRAAGPQIVLLTQGALGASGWLPSGERVDVPAQTIEFVDAVGAGDSFNAGVLAALADAGALTKPALAGVTRMQMEGALKMGATTAAITVSRAGANPPWRAEL